MAAEPHQELIIIKRHGGHGDGHHGGAWKIAFADFMTAMMALFLVLWLISATNPKQKIAIAHYFNPVKLAEVSVQKKGLDDPVPGEGGHGGPRSGDIAEKRLELPPQEKRALFDRGEAKAGHDEAGLFRDPYAVLAEIAADPHPGEKPKVSDKAEVAASNMAASNPDILLTENIDTFRDPFSTNPSLEPPRFPESSNVPANAQSPENADPVDDLTKDPTETPIVKTPVVKTFDTKTPDAKAPVVSQAVPLLKPAPPPPVAPSVLASQKEKQLLAAKDLAKTPSPAHLTAEQQAVAEAQANEAEAGQLRTEIGEAMHKEAVSLGTPNIEVKSTAEGVLISLTDENTYAMFAVGSAEPQAKTIEVVGKVAQLLKNYPGMIVIRGHTDGRPYKSSTYDNWQLSSARAQMAHYMLVRGGLDEKRIDRIEGYADHQLKLPNDPLAAENRRIEFLLRKDKP